MTITPLADVPQPQVRYGRVVGRFVAFLADSPDEGNTPDEVPLSGRVTLVPRVHVVRWPTTVPPRVAVVERLECVVIDGDLYPPGTTPDDLPDEPGVWVVATEQPEGEPDHVQWSANFKLDGATGRGISAQPPNFTFEVPDQGTVDLSVVVPSSPVPGTVVVVSSEDRIRAEAAAASAQADADRATTAATTATEAATTATTARDEAQTAAATAVEAAASVHGLRIFLVPHDQWPPAEDPNELHWYLRVADEPTPTTEAS